MRILFPVDGSKCSLRAARHLINQSKRSPGDELHLLNVQTALPGEVKLFLGADQVKRYHHDESVTALAAVRRALDKAKVPYSVHMAVGEPAAIISRFVAKLQCDEIVMGTHGRGAIGRMLMGSVATKVLHEAKVPVVLIK